MTKDPQMEDFMQVEFKAAEQVYCAKVWVADEGNDLYYQVAFYPEGRPEAEHLIFVKQDADLNWVQKPDTHVHDLVDPRIVDAIGLEIDDYE